MVQDYSTPILYAMLCSCLWALYCRDAALILGFCEAEGSDSKYVKLEIQRWVQLLVNVYISYIKV